MSVEPFESAELSDLGRKRKNNEDACLRIPGKGVYCVADGMGGVAGGDLASEAIKTTVLEAFAKASPEQCETFAGTVEVLRAAANKASKWIKDFSDEKVIGQMGSTLVGLVFDPRNPTRALALHAGDSRLYRWRDGCLEQLTADHTMAAVMSAKLGCEASTLPARYHNELARAVGLRDSIELEETRVQAKSGDVFLLCSDGLPRMVPDSTISQVLGRAAKEDLPAVAGALIREANEAGGKDNITVLLVKVGDISAFANIEPEPYEPPKTVVAPVVVESPGAPTAKETPNPPTPDTERPEYSSRPAPPAPPPSPPKAEPPRQRAPLIVGALALLVAGTLAYYHFSKSKPSPESSRIATTNAASTNQPIGITAPPATNPVPAPTPAPAPPPAPTLGGLFIRSDPTGADIFSNGQKVGTTPYELSGLPAGQLMYQLGTMTHTGLVVATVTAGVTNASRVTLTSRKGALAVSSDPAGAAVWVDGKALGHTPINLNLDAGERQLELKYPPLKELKTSWTVAADTAGQTNLSFAYGAVEISSDPPGAALRGPGEGAKTTPWTASRLPPGPMTFQLSLADYIPSNVTVQVPEDHSVASVTVRLQRIPMAVAPPKTNPPPPARLAGTGPVWTNRFGGLMWSNRLGMVFLRMPSKDFWIETASVGPEQVEAIAGRDPQDSIDAYDHTLDVGLERAEAFAAKLTADLRQKNEMPAGYENWHLALPTSAQWMSAATNSDALGLGLEKLQGFEWCRDMTARGPAMFSGRYLPRLEEFFAGPVGLYEAAQAKMALRLVLAPPEPTRQQNSPPSE